MDLKHLKYFVAVAEELHFTRAAARLNMTQPPLSQAIGRLEESLGFRLFVRTRRKVQLTDAGRVLLRESRGLLSGAQHALHLASNAASGDVGHVRIAFPPWSEATAIFVDIVREFGKRFPDITVDLHSMPSQAAATALLEGRVDLAFLATPPDPPPGILTEPVLSDSIAVALPEGHPLSGNATIPLGMLASEPQIAVAGDRMEPFYHLVKFLCRQAGFSLQTRHAIDHPQTTLALVSAGLGVSLVPASYAVLGRPHVVFRPVEPSLQVQLLAAWRADEISAVLDSFIEVIRDVKSAGE
ncbi:MAG: LysR substrate-binding domain-containing protein [Rhizobiaceae bacterium]